MVMKSRKEKEQTLRKMFISRVDFYVLSSSSTSQCDFSMNLKNGRRKYLGEEKPTRKLEENVFNGKVEAFR